MRKRDPRSAGTVGLLDAAENAGPILSGLLGIPTEDEGRQMGLLDEAFLAAHAAGDRRGMAEAIGQQAALYGPNMLGAGVIKAYHGSPHSFDKFRMDRIGTGEGAQAYGHGLYFAENEGVARSYRDALAGRAADKSEASGTLGGRLFSELNPEERHAIRMARDWKDPAKAAEAAERQGLPERAAILRQMASGELPYTVSEGRMYEVNINANPEDFLDWDAPLDKQSANVRAYAESRRDKVLPGRDISNMDGDMLWRMSNPQSDLDGREWLDIGPAADASKRLADAGIPGIRYRDAGSRGLDGREGTRNYVVFDENLISIVKKYGIAGAVAAGLLTNEQAQAFVDQQNDQEAVKP